METNTTCYFCGTPIYRKVLHPVSFCNTACKAEHQKLQRPVSVEWLRQKYIEEGLDCTQIARIVERDSKSVWNWLKSSGIPTRKRGYSSTKPFKPGHKIRVGAKLTEDHKDKLRLARLADGHVPYLKDGVHHLKGKRGADTPNWKGGCSPERAAVYGSDEWKSAVKVVWRRDNATCQRCGLDHRTIKRGSIDFDIHHIASFTFKELRCDPKNLVLLCERCHYWVHSRENMNKEFINDGI